MYQSTDTNILNRLRTRFIQEIVYAGVGLSSLLSALTFPGCSKPTDPTKVNKFSTSSNSLLMVDKDSQMFFCPDTLKALTACKNISATVIVDYQGDQEGHRDESFVLWIARLNPDPNDSTKLVVDMDGALPFRPSSSLPCEAVIQDSSGFVGETQRKIGILTNNSNVPAELLQGDYVVIVTHGSAHNAECGRQDSAGTNPVNIVKVTLSGETVLGGNNRSQQVFFVNASYRGT